MGIIDAIRGERVYLDTNIFMYALEAYPEYESSLSVLFAAIDNGDICAVTSELTLAEVLIKPLMNNNKELQEAYEQTIQSSPAFSVFPINRHTLIEAARIRADSELIHLPDAIHLATSRIHQCSSFITNDKRLQRVPDFHVLILSDFRDL